MTSDDLQLRMAEKSDGDEIFALAREFAVSFRPERAPFDAALPQLLENEDAFLMVATCGGTVRGYRDRPQCSGLQAGGEADQPA
jgi:hypothetical protein